MDKFDSSTDPEVPTYAWLHRQIEMHVQRKEAEKNLEKI